MQQNRLATVEEIEKLQSLSLHRYRILKPLSAMIDSYMERSDLSKNRRLIDFFRHIKEDFQDEDYAVIQREYLAAQNIEYVLSQNVISSEIKYLDFPFWAQSKFSIAFRLGLEKYAGDRILDIGAGPGHFGVVARYFGCGYDGLEVPLIARSPFNRRHLFDELCDFFRVARKFQAIRPSKALELDCRYRLVTCLMGNFCAVIFADGSRRAWTWPEWIFFLDDLATNVLTPEYNMYFNVGRDFLPPEVLENIRKFAKTFDETSSVFTFDQTLDLDALRRSAPEAPSAAASA
jgi:hypothetical protein